MTRQPGRVPKLTPQEMADLRSWNFIKSYNRRHTELIDLAKIVYTSTCTMLTTPPDEDQFYQAYSRSLKWANLYVKRIVGSMYHLPPSVYEYYAGLLAKYVLEQDWQTISSIPCP